MNSTDITNNSSIKSTVTKSPFIVAFDCADLASANHLADQLSPALCRAKVGKELFTACGMAVVDMLHSKGYEVFLDLKYHDIPTTVAKAVAVVANAGIWMVNVHASGGQRMMSAAIEAASQSNTTHLIAVTVLTSMTDEDLQLTGVARTVEEQVMFLADSAKSAGLNGVVCSAQEATQLRQRCGNGFLLVTPGIRPANAVADDQRRTLTPRQAIDAGSDYLVVGRPITQADDPLQALQEMLASLD
ncbi:orotidine-5'-phosphate decarboxylase [Pseudomonadales bacterium]|nr:orotidine-5'-phosphate decarboxylase [Pseudomonadales bacterium]